MTSSQQPMITLPPERTVEPFGKVNIRKLPDERIWVRAYMLIDRAIEGARTGIAIDGSGTMRPWFGARRKGEQNLVSPFVRQMCAYLASKADATGRVAAIYWATGPDGEGIEEIGTLTADEASQTTFQGPVNYGDHTCLLPALRYFTDRFASASWGLYVFITDGRLDDLAAVKAHTTQLAREIAAGTRNDVKLVIIGVGQHISESEMVELDDLDTGTSLDLWDHKTVETMQHLAAVFTEVVDERMIIAHHGLVRDSFGGLVMDYRDTGVPALLEFTLPAGATSFTLEIGDVKAVQPL